jgi:hypothetical protein
LLLTSPPPPKWQGDGNKGGRKVKAEATKKVIAMTTRVARDGDGDGNDGKSNGDGNKGGE